MTHPCVHPSSRERRSRTRSPGRINNARNGYLPARGATVCSLFLVFRRKRKRKRPACPRIPSGRAPATPFTQMHGGECARLLRGISGILPPGENTHGCSIFARSQNSFLRCDLRSVKHKLSIFLPSLGIFAV